MHYVGILRPIENIVVRIFSPIQHRIYGVGIKINSFYTNYFVNKDLVQSYQDLEQQITDLKVENSQLKIKISDSVELSALQDYLASSGLEGVTAKIIGKNPEPSHQSIILNRGSSSGVTVDSPLITANGIMVGKVSNVKRNSSEAILVNDSDSRIAALVQNETNSKGIVIGEHGLSLKMELLPQEDEVKAGDVIITSGLEQTIPQGLVIGEVNQVITEPNSLFKTARVKSLIKIDNLTQVIILTSQIDD
ncbi:MAG: rod shape-determining protein MreC [Parcubacteria group bacterium]|nr:rod shape-determining protein MreC [Parcubacteria group bacterium]